MREYVHLGKIHRFSHFWVAVPVQWFVVEFGTHLFGPQDLRVAKVQGVDSKSIPGLPVGRSKNLGKLRAYLSLCRKLLQRARQTMAQLEEQNIGTDTLDACRAPMDQKRRDQIPHEEKVFFDPCTLYALDYLSESRREGGVGTSCRLFGRSASVYSPASGGRRRYGGSVHERVLGKVSIDCLLIVWIRRITHRRTGKNWMGCWS